MAEYDADAGKATVVVCAFVDGVLAGAYYLKPNGPGLGAHIANAGYVVGPACIEAPASAGASWRTRSSGPRASASMRSSSTSFSRTTPPAGSTRSYGWEVVGRTRSALPDGRGGPRLLAGCLRRLLCTFMMFR